MINIINNISTKSKRLKKNEKMSEIIEKASKEWRKNERTNIFRKYKKKPTYIARLGNTKKKMKDYQREKVSRILFGKEPNFGAVRRKKFRVEWRTMNPIVKHLFIENETSFSVLTCSWRPCGFFPHEASQVLWHDRAFPWQQKIGAAGHNQPTCNPDAKSHYLLQTVIWRQTIFFVFT